MQVWPQRTHDAGNGPRAERASAGKAVAETWALRVLSGMHAGAERRLDTYGMLLVGSSDDCDIILADAGVLAHHCILTFAEGALSVRAIDADVRVDDRPQHPGDAQPLAPFSTIQIGSASFAIGPHWSERWQSVLRKVDQTAVATAPSNRRIGRGKVAALWAAALMLIASGGALVLAQHRTDAPPPKMPAESQEQILRSLIAGVAPNGLMLHREADGAFVVDGYVEHGDDLDVLKAKIAQRGLAAKIEAKSGPRIADEIGEFFRMNSIHATTQWNGKGHVQVRGRFGDEKELKSVLTSRTMQEFNENLNLKVEVENLDPPQPEIKAVPDGKRIRRVVEGNDAYLVTVDGSRYYRGAKLPQGGVFVGVENDDVLVQYDADIRRIPRDTVTDGELQ